MSQSHANINFTIQIINILFFQKCMRFCPKCGKNIESGTFCSDCSPKKEINIKDISIKICTSCNKYFDKSSWTMYNNIETPIKSIVKSMIKKQTKNPELKILIEKIEKKPGTELNFEIEIIDNNENYLVPAKLEFSYCNTCSKLNGTYFEGDLQLRTENQEIIKFVFDYLGPEAAEKNRINDGMDIKVINKKRLSTLGDQLQKKFGGILKKSPRLFTRDHLTSKEVYRLNVFFKPYDFLKGDIIVSNKKIYKITKLGKTIIGTELHKSTTTPIDVKDYETLKKLNTTISKTNPCVEVLHPETYDSIPIKNYDKNQKYNLGEKVKIVLYNENAYLIS